MLATVEICLSSSCVWRFAVSKSGALTPPQSVWSDSDSDGATFHSENSSIGTATGSDVDVFQGGGECSGSCAPVDPVDGLPNALPPEDRMDFVMTNE